MLVTGLISNESKHSDAISASCWHRLLGGSITLLISLLFKPVTTDQHPYMRLVSVLYKPVSSIASLHTVHAACFFTATCNTILTSLSFYKRFYPCFSSFFNWITVYQLNYYKHEGGRHVRAWEKMAITPGRTDRQFIWPNFKLNHVRNNHLLGDLQLVIFD